MRALAAILLLGTALAETPARLSASAPPPEKSARATWVYETTAADGLWLTDDQAKRVAAEMIACRDTTLGGQRSQVPWWLWTAAGVVAGGAAVWIVR